jgi:hypothetical protein
VTTHPAASLNDLPVEDPIRRATRTIRPRMHHSNGLEQPCPDLVCSPTPGPPSPLEPQLAEAGPAWAEIAAEHGLAERDLTQLASAWHTDMDLGREMEVVTDMTRNRLAGFCDYQSTLRSFLDLFARLQKERIILA